MCRDTRSSTQTTPSYHALIKSGSESWEYWPIQSRLEWLYNNCPFMCTYLYTWPTNLATIFAWDWLLPIQQLGYWENLYCLLQYDWPVPVSKAWLPCDLHSCQRTAIWLKQSTDPLLDININTIHGGPERTIIVCACTCTYNITHTQ